MSKGFNRPVPHDQFIREKYLSTREESEEKTKKKRLYKAATKWKKIRIYDDDLDLKKLGRDELGSDDELYYGTKEEKPVIAAVIDERPLHLKRKDMKSRWVAVEGPDGDTTQDSKDSSRFVDDNDNSQHSSSSNSEKTPAESNKDKDLSPPRKRPICSLKDLSPPRRPTSSQKDLSPPRPRTSSRRNVSPPRRSMSSKNDVSPPRRRTSSERNVSPPRRGTSSKNDLSSPRRSTNSNKDLSPTRRHNSSQKLSRCRRSNSLQKDSPPPKSRSSHVQKELSSPPSRLTSLQKNLSPPRRPSISHKNSPSHRSRSSNTEQDLSPPRSRVSSIQNDLSPPRRSSSSKKDLSPRQRSDGLQSHSIRHGESSKSRHGLCDAKSIRDEANKARDREKEIMSSKDAAALGKGAKTVYRDKSGKIRDLEKEREEAEKKNEIDEEKNAKYKEWNMGLKQREDQKTKAEDAIHEMSKPLARYEDDEDLDKLLREKEQEEDPMLEYMRKKKWKEKVKDADQKGEKILQKPKYNGPTPAPLNRYGIQPGYRWDGVDRSNGFEKDYFARIAEKTAIREEAYRWSTEDM